MRMKRVQVVFVSGQNRDVMTVSELGLYKLMFKSRKEEAKKHRERFISTNRILLHTLVR